MLGLYVFLNILSRVIIISGSSGTGKTSVVDVLQEMLLPEVWLKFSFDSIIYSLPGSVLEQCNLHNNWSGVNGKALYAGSIACLRSLVETGNNVIFDVALSNDKQVNELEATLRTIEVESFHIEAEWAEIQKRTLARGDRTLEEADRSFKNNFPYSCDSITLNSTELSSIDLSRIISSKLSHSKNQPVNKSKQANP